VAIVRPPLGLEKLRTRNLVTEPRVACVPERHPIARRTKVAVPRLLGEPIVATPGEGVWRDYWILTEYREEQQMLSMRRLLSKPSSRLSLAGNQGSQPGRSALRQLRYRLPLLPGREAPRVVGLGDTQRRRAEEAAHHRRYDRGRPHARFKAEGDPTVDGVA